MSGDTRRRSWSRNCSGMYRAISKYEARANRPAISIAAPPRRISRTPIGRRRGLSTQNQASADVVEREARIALDDRLGRIARGEHAKDMLDCKPMAAHDRLAAEDAGIGRDSLAQFRVCHATRIRGRHRGLNARPDAI